MLVSRVRPCGYTVKFAVHCSAQLRQAGTALFDAAAQVRMCPQGGTVGMGAQPGPPCVDSVTPQRPISIVDIHLTFTASSNALAAERLQFSRWR
jgi:hypothetical protein